MMRLFRRLLDSAQVQRMGRKEQPVYASKRQIFVCGIVIVAALIAIYSWQNGSIVTDGKFPRLHATSLEFLAPAEELG
jgi:uncharacterized membrane protein YidH (DUF202 family)